MAMEKQVGSSSFKFEEPCIGYLSWSSDVTAEHVHELDAELAKAAEGKDGILVVVDLSRCTPASFPADVRRQIAEDLKEIRILGQAVVGASFQMRVLARLVNGAIQLFQQHKHPLAFFDTEADAREWALARTAQLSEEKS